MNFSYFAYGLNLNSAKMRELCPGSIFLCRAHLSGYRLVFDGKSRMREGATANIIKSPGEQVWGVLYLVSRQGLLSLDEYEGYPHYCQRIQITAWEENNGMHWATAYAREPQPLGPPGQDYLAEILHGAEERGLPKPYINSYLRRSA